MEQVMSDVKLIQVIETKLLRRGQGTEASPIRIITQYWSTDGKLLAEVDPYLMQKENDHE